MYRVAENEQQPVPKPASISASKINPTPTASPTTIAASGASLESVARRPRRKFSAADKARIVNAAEAAVRSGERGALEALIRREGIYSSQLSTWRQQFSQSGVNGFTPNKPGRKPKLDAKDQQLLAALQANRKLAHRLHVANLVIDLQKKAHAILGLALPEYDEESL
jgi:transposase